MRHAEDATSVDLFVKQLQKEAYNPIILYKPQGTIDTEIAHYKIVLSSLQTEFQ